jgi:dTDP-4-amino-4,6-dideoxygalactose transaminase
MKFNITFNKPYLSGNELAYIEDTISTGKISGNGKYTELCHSFFKEKYGFNNCLLTTSCTDALEMAAILINIQPGDEVIIPSYTFVSTANAFIIRGAKVVFADSRLDHPGMDEDSIEMLITEKTKAIVPVHYAGISCDMDKIMKIAKKHDIWVIEDAAQAIDSYYIDSNGQKKILGSIGHLSAFSFHETKNIISGEGGMLVINENNFIKRAEIIWEKGTNRSEFFRGHVDKYGWVDIGSSFLPSDIIAAFLYAQLEKLENIQSMRIAIWNQYMDLLKHLSEKGKIKLPIIPNYASNNAHMFYINVKDLKTRTKLIDELKDKGVNAVFHYISLHSSKFYKDKHDGRVLLNSDYYTDSLIRLPFYNGLSNDQIHYICNIINQFFS